MLRIYMEIDINGTRGIALYAPILRIWVVADLQIRAKLDIWGYQYLLAQMFDIQLFPTRID